MIYLGQKKITKRVNSHFGMKLQTFSYSYALELKPMTTAKSLCLNVWNPIEAPESQSVGLRVLWPLQLRTNTIYKLTVTTHKLDVQWSTKLGFECFFLLQFSNCGARRSRVNQGEAGWSKVEQGGAGCSRLEEGGLERSRVDQVGIRWSRVE